MSGSDKARVGGRPATVGVDDIVRVGRAIGMRELTLKAVASELGVSSTALYRHVDGRWALERLIGESLLAELEPRDDPDHDTVRHLLSFGLRLRAFILDRPGLAAYLQVLFPRGDAGRRLLAAEVAALGRRGHSAEAAIALSGAVASLTIGYAVAEEAQREHADGLDAERREVEERLRADPGLGPAHGSLPPVAAADYVRLVLTAAIRGLVAAAPPGRPLAETVAELAAAGEGV
ncbi:TetR/AcrR family transcriptional regulator [Actinokineospora sp. G85]|uniref:TetR/AcrR family transcriptional regulator n=1 Tax=Actinokineospora sp. G85 TaxID=3406626 RepID=UPI003C79700D